jgi:ketosteroid isomerase-like protein
MKRLLMTLIIVTVSAAGAWGACSESDRMALESFDRAWAKAGMEGNRTALMAIYADDYAALPGMVNKQTTIANTMSDFEANRWNPAPSGTYDHYLITCSPASATITHRNSFVAKGADGVERTVYSRSVHFLEKRDGRWQVVSDAGGPLNDAAVIWYLEQDWNDAAPKRNKAWFENNWAPDFVSVSSGTGRLNGKSQEIADMMSDKGTLELTETTDMNINVDGNIATVTGVYRMKGKDEKGVAYDRKIRYIDTWVKRNGRWLALSSAGANIQN